MELKNYFAQDAEGNAQPSAACYLYNADTTNLVNGLVDAQNQPLTNPFVSDSYGLIQFKAPNGIYDLRVISGNRDYKIRVQAADVTELIDGIDEAVAAADAATAAADISQSKADIAATAATNAVDARDDAESYAVDVLSSVTEVNNNRILAQQAVFDAENAAETRVTILRDELAGADGPSKIGRSAYFVASVQELIALPQVSNSRAVVTSYHPISAKAPVGGGLFRYDNSRLRSTHDGMNVFSPTVPFTWDDLGTSYLYGIGDTAPTSNGCWVRQSADTNAYNAGAIEGTNVTASIKRAMQLMNVVSLLKGNFIITPDAITLTSSRHIIGAGQEITNVELSDDTVGWGLLSKGNYNSISRLSLKVKTGSTTFSGSLVQVENDGFVTYKQEFRDLYLKGVSGKVLGKGIHFYTASDTGKGITIPLVDNLNGWNLRSLLHFSKSGSGYTDSGMFTRIRASICAYAVDIEYKSLGSSKFDGVHGRYDVGFTLGHIVNRGTRISIKDCLIYDYASPYIFIEPEAIGTIIDCTTLVSQGSSVQDKGWGTQFIGPANSVTPESSGGAGYGWLEQTDNCLGFDPTRNWNVTKTGTSTAAYTGTLNTLGPMMLLTASGSVGSYVDLGYGTSYQFNPFQQTKISGYFWISSSPANGRVEYGIFNSAGTTSVSLVADTSITPNFFFLIKQSGSADVTVDTGKPVGTKRHSFGITRTGTSGGLTLHFDVTVVATNVAFAEATSLLQPRFRLTNLTASTANVYISALSLRTTSDNYVTDWAGAL